MNIHESESKGIRASGYMNGNQFVVIKGSYAVGDTQVTSSLEDKPARKRMREKLIVNRQLIKDGNKYRFEEDVEFNSPSEAASIVWGSNLNGRLVFGLDDTTPKTHKLYYDIENSKAVEGYKVDRVLTVTERNQTLVKQRKEIDNYTCQACGFRLFIGERAVIECHHLDPISLGERETTIDDLVSLCPTCHRIVHMREPIYNIQEISSLAKSLR